MKWLHVFPPTHRLCYHSQVRGLIFIYVFTYSVFIYLFTLWYNPFVRICFTIDIYYCFISLFSSGLRSFTLCDLISSFIILLEQATSTPSESNVPYALYNNLLFFFPISPSFKFLQTFSSSSSSSPSFMLSSHLHHDVCTWRKQISSLNFRNDISFPWTLKRTRVTEDENMEKYDKKP